jgi:hypothetical protein
MNRRLEQIRQLLGELEDDIGTGVVPPGDRGFSALELPVIVQEIVDDLQPLLTPYEAAFYWYLFRHSIAQNGSQLLRVSTRGLQTGVVKSSRSDTIALTQVRETLAALESVGAIRKEGEPNRDGTPYRVLIPDEIEACRNHRAERVAAEPKPEVSESEIDYYNVRENRIKVYERDSYKCRYCGKQLTRFTATLDHLTPVTKEGDNSFGNLVTACLDCNSRKTGRPVGDFLAEQTGDRQ